MSCNVRKKIYEIAQKKIMGVSGNLCAIMWQKYTDGESQMYVPEGKKHFCTLPMGIKNAAPFFVCMMLQLKAAWDHNFFKTPEGLALVEEVCRRYHASVKETIAKLGALPPAEMLERDNPGSAVIVDDLLIYARSPIVLLAYFISILRVLQHHWVAIKLRKTRFLPSSAEFVGLDLLPHGNSPASSKFPAIAKLTRPILFGDIHMLIGLFGFYSKWLPYFEDDVSRWRDMLSKKPPVNTGKLN